jgi:hypothetical protein
MPPTSSIGSATSTWPGMLGRVAATGHPLAATDHGFTLRPGGGNTHTLATAAGRLTVTGFGKTETTQTMNSTTCYFAYTSRQQFKFISGKSTGKFAGATGPGAYQASFGAYAPRCTSGKHKGQCDTVS